MADQDDVVAVGRVAPALYVHLGDQRAGGIQRTQAAHRRVLLDLLRHAVGAEHRDGPIGNLIDLFDEAYAFRLQVFHDPKIMDDFVPHIDWGPVLLQRRFDDLDGALDTGTKPARLR